MIKLKLIDKILLIAFLVIVVTIINISVINKYIAPILKSYAKSEIIMINTFIINESINSLFKDNNIDNIFDTETNDNNEIISLDFNTTVINKILYDVTNSIQTSIKNIEQNKIDELIKYDSNLTNNGIVYRIPIGVVMDNSITSSLGPKIPIYASLIGDVSTSIKTEVNEYGINSGLIKVFIDITITEEVVLPFKTDRLTLEKEMLLGMKIINGVVPKYYGNPFTLETPLVSTN